MSAFAADLLLVLHLGFVAFVVLGGLLVWRWPRLSWLHLPAALWGALVEFNHWVCPLTPLEQRLRAGAGESGYDESFVEHYLLPLLYPQGLTPTSQWVMGALVVGINALVYGALLWKRKRSRGPGR